VFPLNFMEAKQVLLAQSYLFLPAYSYLVCLPVARYTSGSRTKLYQ
jgi:hypothetical protein